MKNFKSTGHGPKSGFSFPSNFGFRNSSGKTRSVSGYTRKPPKRVVKKAVGGLTTGQAPDVGWADFNKGGSVKTQELKKTLGAQYTKAEARAIEQKGHKSFRRDAVIGK